MHQPHLCTSANREIIANMVTSLQMEISDVNCKALLHVTWEPYICTCSKLRAAPSRYHALAQSGRNLRHCWALDAARSPSLSFSQHRLWLASMVASCGSMALACMNNRWEELG
jgi:hypothetical protein